MCPSPNKTGRPIVKTRPTAGKNRSRNVLIIALALTLSATPQPSEAAWWLGYKAIKKVIKLIDPVDKKYRKADRKDRDKSDKDEDGYNPYHNHPDGLPSSDHPPYYNEDPYKKW